MCASLFLSSSFGHFYPPNIPPLLNDFISYHHLTQHHLDFLQLKYFENLSNPQHFAGLKFGVFVCPWFAVLTNFLKLFRYQFSTILETFPCIFRRETHLRCRYDSCDVRSASLGSASATNFRSTDNLVHEKFCTPVNRFPGILLSEYVSCVQNTVNTQLGPHRMFCAVLCFLISNNINEDVQGQGYAQVVCTQGFW